MPMTREDFINRTERFTQNKVLRVNDRMEVDLLLPLLLHHWPEVAELRGLQAEALSAHVCKHDSLVIMPTGAGKSLCYQLPAVLPQRGLTIVISPLIALMKDQVDPLTRRGISAASLHSGQSRYEQTNVLEGCRRGLFSLLYVSPERVLQPEFLTFLSSIDNRQSTIGNGLAAFVIDESHCISQWGHEFRPEYGKLGFLRRIFDKVPIHAYTATATQRVRLEICDVLGLRDPLILVGDFDRPNLFLSVVKREPPGERFNAQLLELLFDENAASAAAWRQRRIPTSLPGYPSHPSHSAKPFGVAIVYCPTHIAVEFTAKMLEGNGIPALGYHAGMAHEERTRVQDAFLSPNRQSTIDNRQSCDVVVATIAFGMGIDRSDVRQVIHTSMPQSLEQYHQEIGRAGRDGHPARCTILYDSDDFDRICELTRLDPDECITPDAVGKAQRLGQMLDYCDPLFRHGITPNPCRHRLLCEYFGQTYEAENCGACDVCV